MSGKTIVIDYGVGNTGSILNMLRKLGTYAELSSDPAALEVASRLILPGVGAFDTAMAKLRESDLLPVLERRVLGDGVPILGVCLGMQLLGRGSQEGRLPGLGWIDAYCVRFDIGAAANRIRIPHMGWNTARFEPSSQLSKDMARDARFYFVHSYHLKCQNSEDVLCSTDYGYPFVSGVARGNIYGVQFHPEKSHRFGFALLRNFVAL